MRIGFGLLALLSLAALAGCEGSHAKSHSRAAIRWPVLGMEEILTVEQKRVAIVVPSGTSVKVPEPGAEWSRLDSVSDEVYEIGDQIGMGPVAIIDIDCTATVSGKYKAGALMRVKVSGTFNEEILMPAPCDFSGSFSVRHFDRRQIYGTIYRLGVYSRSIHPIRSRIRNSMPSTPAGYTFDRQDNDYVYCSAYILWSKPATVSQFEAAVDGESLFHLDREANNPYKSVDLVMEDVRSNAHHLIKALLNSEITWVQDQKRSEEARAAAERTLPGT